MSDMPVRKRKATCIRARRLDGDDRQHRNQGTHSGGKSRSLGLL
jgi:hypothetical protein